jgi:hypothetical protein
MGDKPPSDYMFMRSGAAQPVETHAPLTAEQLDTAPALLAVLLEEATEDALTYAEHADVDFTTMFVLMALKRQILSSRAHSSDPDALLRATQYMQHLDNDTEDALPDVQLTRPCAVRNTNTQMCECEMCEDMRVTANIIWPTWRPTDVRGLILQSAVEKTATAFSSA